MSKPRPKTNAQVGRMFGLAKPLAAQAGMETDEYLRLVVASKTSQTSGSISQLTFDEANTVIKSLGGDPFSARGNSVRMQNYRKQAAGIKTIETERHLHKMRELAEQLGWDEARLTGFCQRQIKKDSPTTTEEGNSVIEGLKAMLKRSNVRAFPSKKPAAQPTAEPSFRRVA